MLTLPRTVRIFLAPGATDMRKSFDGLAAAAKSVIREDPLSGHVFVFCNRLLTETFRRLVLDELVKAERLSPEFMEKLLGFRHGGGFSVYGRHLILNTEPARLAHMARYAVRPPVRAERVHEAADGRVLLEIPPDPRTGDTVLHLDPLEWLRRLVNQIPEPRAHQVRYYG